MSTRSAMMTEHEYKSQFVGLPAHPVKKNSYLARDVFLPTRPQMAPAGRRVDDHDAGPPHTPTVMESPRLDLLPHAIDEPEQMSPRRAPRGSAQTPPLGTDAAPPPASPPASPPSPGHADAPDGTTWDPAEREWKILEPDPVVVPSGWLQVESRTRHKMFFYNKSTGESRWRLPDGLSPRHTRRQARSSPRRGLLDADCAWIPERRAEPQEPAPHSIATACMGPTRRLALSLGDWLATLRVPAESMCWRRDENEGRELAAPSAAYAPPEAPIFVSGRMDKYKAFLSERAGDASRPPALAADGLGYTPSSARAVKELMTVTSPRRGR